MMKFRAAVVAAAILAVGLAGCSSATKVAAPGPGEIANGTAKISVNGTDVGPVNGVACSFEQAFTTITTGDAKAGTTSVVNNIKGLAVNAVRIRNLGGVSGSYVEDLQGEAKLEQTGRTYTIAGRVAGYSTEKPGPRTDEEFSIQVAC